MKYYLLDYENVNASGLDGIGELSSDCRIVLFYTKNSSKIDLGVFNMLRNMEAEMSIIEVHHGKQALDIQLASYLGYLIGTEPADTEYFIISKDKGYRNVQSFWPDRRIVLCRNLSPESEIVDEPAPEKKTSSRSGSRGGRKSSSAKASSTAKATAAAKAPAAEEPKEETKEKPKASRSSGRTKAQTKPVEDVKVAEANAEGVKKDAPKKDVPKKDALKKDAPKKDAPKTEVAAEQVVAEPAVAEEPKPNAFAEAAAIAKAVVEAKKARNEAAAKKAEKAENAPAEKPAEKEEEPAKKTKKTASKKKSEDSKQKAAESKQQAADDKQKAAEAKHKASDIRNEVNNEIQKRLSKENVDGDIINATASFVSKNIGKDGFKQLIYRGIIKEHGQKQGLAIYRLIKDIL